MKGDTKTLLRKFCHDSTVMGVKYFYIYTDCVSRFLWTVIMVATFTLACILTGLLYKRFDEMPTRITIENHYEPTTNVPYPAIAICTPNQITLSGTRHFKQTLVNGNKSIDLDQILPNLLGLYETGDGEYDKGKLSHLQNLIDLNRYTVTEVMGLLPQKCQDFLKVCYFKGKVYRSCSDLFKPILTKHGMCCVFNSIYHYNNTRNEEIPNFEPHRVVSSGFADSLTIISDFEPDDALDATLANAGAIRIMFTDWKEFPADDESSLIHPHVESFHVIHPTFTYCSDDVATLPATSRKCFFEDEESLPHFGQFHNSDCDLLCYVKLVQDVCHCTMIYVPQVKKRDACDVTRIECIMSIRSNMVRWYDLDSCYCPRDCISYRYHVDNILGNLKALPYMVSDSYAGIVFNQSTSLIHLIPSSVYVKQKQETVVSLITLASNLGGIFGLCLGCSVISVLEILFYIYMAIKNKILGRARTAGNVQKMRKGSVFKINS